MQIGLWDNFRKSDSKKDRGRFFFINIIQEEIKRLDFRFDENMLHQRIHPLTLDDILMRKVNDLNFSESKYYTTFKYIMNAKLC